MRKNFLKNRTQNMLQKLLLDPFLKNQNWAYNWINSLKVFRARYTQLYCENNRTFNILKIFSSLT